MFGRVNTTFRCVCETSCMMSVIDRFALIYWHTHVYIRLYASARVYSVVTFSLERLTTQCLSVCLSVC